MEVHKNLTKFKLLLENVFEGKTCISESYAEKLLKFLEDRNENSIGRLILETPGFSDLIFHSLEKISNVCIPLKVFIIEIVTILFKNELQFTKMHMQGLQATTIRFCILGNLNSIPQPNLHLACIKLATVQITHCSGLKVILEHKVWKSILHPNLHKRPKKICKAVFNFMAKLVLRLNEYDLKPALLEVLGHIVEPIISSEYLEAQMIDMETDIMLSDKIFTHVSALLAVLSETNNLGPLKRVCCLLEDRFLVGIRLFLIFESTKIPSLVRLLNSCLFTFFLATNGGQLANNSVDEFCNNMTAFYRNTLVNAINKRDAFVLIDHVVECTIIWSNFEKSRASEFSFPLTFERNGQKIDFSFQLTIHLIVPMLKYYCMYRISQNMGMTDVIEQFLVKMGKTITDHIYTCTYMFAGLLEEGGSHYRTMVTTHVLKELPRLKGHINEAQAGLIFQSLYYLLEIFILSDGDGRLVVKENPLDAENSKLLSHLLEAIKMLLKEHNISWYEIVEIVNIQAYLLDLLKQNYLTMLQIVQVLDLIDICVKKFLSPNMSLLVDSKCAQDNTLSEIGAVVKLHTQHANWEVRDSAFNLLNTCTDISFIKYIPFQKVIRDNNLIILAAKAGLTDTEFYSQCTALKCMAAATKIDTMWEEVLIDNPNIYLQLVYILKNHPEGMVRKEAATVLKGVYANQKVPSTFHNTLYEVMITASLDDLHWEVQLAALNFWKKAIHNHLTYRGMFDGKFPSVTFSKEKRKIIVLNDVEIQRQLTCIMDDLSRIGCLTVLSECMNEMHHIEVMANAFGVAKELIDMLDKYKFGAKATVQQQSPPPSQNYMEEDNNMPLDLSCASEEERDKVIDSILSVDHSELIINLHDNYCQAKSDDMDIDFAFNTSRDLIHADKFLEKFKSNNYSDIIEKRIKCNADCINSLDELLDEILDL